MNDHHEMYMKLALQTAAAAKGQTEPNPLVGAVIVNDNRIVGIGAHLKAGEPHAEIHALRMAGEQARGGTIYVTLEPCSHHGRTGPCAEAIIEAGISKVVVAAQDPNPLVSGRGIRMIREAGIEVEAGVCEEESVRMNEVFNAYIVRKRPFVTMKSAITLDGKIATAASHSKWITSEAARADVHRLRNESGAILVGVNTVLKDDPELTTRIANGRNPVRIIVDSTLRIPLDAKVVRDGKAATWVFAAANHNAERRKALEALGVRVYATSGEDAVHLSELLDLLGGQSISSLLVEGGGEVNASFMASKLVDKLVLYVAPKLVGGRNAPTFLEGSGIESMDDAIQFSHIELDKIGQDYRFTGYPKWE